MITITKKITTQIILTLIAGLNFIPFVINSNLGTLPLRPSFIQNTISIVLLTIIITIGLFRLSSLKSIKLSYSSLYLFAIIIFLGVQFAIIRPSYTAPYLNAMSLLTIIVIAIIIIQNSTISPKQILFYIALGILINSYWQIIFATLQLIHTKIEYKVLFYGFDQPYNLIGNLFKFSEDSRITGGIGQHNNFADILSWGILASLYLFSKPTKTHTIFFWINLITISIFVARAESRTAYFYPLVLLSYALYLWKYKTIKNNQEYLIKLIISCSIMLLILIIYHILEKNHFIHQINYDNLNPFDNPEERESLRAMSVNERFTMWGRAWMMFIRHPLIGIGWDQYLQYFLITPTPSFIHNVIGELAAFSNCHNLILQLLATTGIFGTLLFIALILCLTHRLTQQNQEYQILPMGVGLIVLVHSMFEYPLFNPAILIPILIIATTTVNEPNTISITIKNKKLFIYLGIIIITLVWLIIGIGINNFLILSQAKKPTNYRIHKYEHNILNIYFAAASNPYWDDAADSVIAQNLLYSVRTQQNHKYFDLTYDVITRSAKYSPNPSFVLRLAVLDTVLGKKEKAQAEVNLVLNNYGKFESDFKTFFNDVSSNDPSLNKKLLELLPK